MSYEIASVGMVFVIGLSEFSNEWNHDRMAWEKDHESNTKLIQVGSVKQKGGSSARGDSTEGIQPERDRISERKPRQENNGSDCHRNCFGYRFSVDLSSNPF